MARSVLTLLSASFGVSHALCAAHAPSLRTRAPTMMAWWDSSDFLENPSQFITDHPEVSPDLPAAMSFIKAYQQRKQALSLWGELPDELEAVSNSATLLQQKSSRADELAQIIAQAEGETLQTLAADATFEEKRAFFEELARLPHDAHGMLAIHDVMTRMRASGEMPLMDRFDGDLADVTAKVAAANQALAAFDAAYSTLFLSVRKVAMLANAAEEAKHEVFN